jgi:hypothetical protein
LVAVVTHEQLALALRATKPPFRLEVNRWVAEQALLAARRFRAYADVRRAQRILSAIDKRKSVRRMQRMEA